MEDNRNVSIVGLSYEIADITNQKLLIIEREVGRKTSQKIEIAHGYNWNNNQKGYSHSFIHLGDEGPFYSIVGGYTDYTSKDLHALNVKDDEWGIKSEKKFCIREGYAWNRFLNQEGYSRTYIYLLEQKEKCNVIGGKIRSTTNDSRFFWLDSSSFGKEEGKEVIWAGSYGLSKEYGEGYNWFTLYLDEKIIKLDNSDFLEKIKELQKQTPSIQLRIPNKSERISTTKIKKEFINQEKKLLEYSRLIYSTMIKTRKV